MSLVYIGDNNWINPALAAKVHFELDFNIENEKRISTTTIYDATGLNVIYRLQTEVKTDEYEGRLFAITFDNERHNQIIIALKEGRDALENQELIDHVNEIIKKQQQF